MLYHKEVDCMENAIDLKKESEIGSRKPRVLIVEDDEAVSKLLHAILEEDVQIEEGNYVSAQQTVAMLDQKSPDDPKIDLLISDLGLEDGAVAGTRVVEAFRKKYPESSIVILTGNRNKMDGLYAPGQREELKFEVWDKPLHFPALRQKISAVKTSVNKTPQA